MSLESAFSNYLKLEKEYLTGQILAAERKLVEIDLLLADADGGDEIRFNGPVREILTDPLTRSPNGFGAAVATTTMGRCRGALHHLRREATTQEIREVIQRDFKSVPAKTITEMLYKSARRSKSGIYRVEQEHGPAKYGLTMWQTGERGPDGYKAPDDHEIPVNDNE